MEEEMTEKACELSPETASESCEAAEEAAAPEQTESVGQEQGPVLTDEQKVGLLEALLLASGDPLPISRAQEILRCQKSEVLAFATSLRELYAPDTRGLELVTISDKLQLRTKPIFAEHVRQLIAVKPRKLSQAALETLAVIAYQQPVVKSEIDKIRGVDVSPTIKTLLERKLVKILGYQASVGQPALYGTTEDFLSVFGLSSLAELPSLRDLKALVREPGEASEEGQEVDPITEDAQEVSPESAELSSAH